MGLLERIKTRLVRTRSALSDGLAGLLRGGRPIDAAVLGEIEALLYAADLGSLATELIAELERRHKRGELGGEADVRAALRASLLAGLGPAAGEYAFPARPTVILVVGVMVIALPQMVTQAGELVNRLPQFGQKLIGLLEGTRDRLLTFRLLTEEQRLWLQNLSPDNVGTILQQNSDVIASRLWSWALSLLRHVWSIFGLLGYLVVTPVVMYYLLTDWRPMLVAAESLIPPGRRETIVGFLDRYDKALGGFVRGQLIEATLVAVITTIGLMILGVPSALFLGATAGLFNLIPYIGIVISAVPALIIALTMEDPLSGLWRVALVYGVVQFIDGNITGPRIVGQSAGLHPLWVMLALAIGGATMGFIGLLLAVPLAILVKMLGERALASYRMWGTFIAVS